MIAIRTKILLNITRMPTILRIIGDSERGTKVKALLISDTGIPELTRREIKEIWEIKQTFQERARVWRKHGLCDCER